MKKNKFKKILIFLTPLIVCVFVCLLLGQKLVFDCLWWDCVNSGYFEPEEIQIPRDFFPDDATYGKLGPVHDTDNAKQYHRQQIYWGSTSTALLHIRRYFGISAAQKGFSTDVRILGELFYIPPVPSNELNYKSNTADQLFTGCSGSACIFIARYNQDLVSISVDIDEQMTLEDFKRIAMYLDRVSAEHLGH